MAKYAKSILRKLIEDADDPFITIWNGIAVQPVLSLPAMGDPYYTVDANLTQEEFELITKEFPKVRVVRR